MKLPTIRSFYIDGVRNIKNLTINFDPALNIIIGPNGVGKTTILNIIKNFLSGEYYNFQASLGDINATVICKFYEVILTQEVIDYFNISQNLMMYTKEIEDPEDIHKILPDFVLELQKNYDTLQTTNFLHSDIKELKDNNGSFITYVIKKKNPNTYFYDPTGTVAGFILVGKKLFASPGLSRNNILKYYKDKSINFGLTDNDDFYLKLLSKLEEKKELHSKFSRFQSEATRTLNSLTPSTDQFIKYSTSPKMNTEVYNKDGKNILYLSSGEKQLERLKLFLSAKKGLFPEFSLLDEPELHLNYSQLTYLSDLIKELLTGNKQVFISSHSPYFLRAFPSKSLVYLRFNKINNPTFIPLVNLPIKQNLAIYPELFFAEKIIIVEGTADSVFFQRTIDIILRNLNQKDLSAKNIYVLSVNGKSNIKTLINFVNKYLGVDYVVITDIDFILDDNHYRFISQDSKNILKPLISKIILEDDKKTIERFKNLDDISAHEFLEFVEKILDKKYVTKKDFEYFKQFKKRVQSHVYKTNLFDKHNLSTVFSTFRKEKIWLLEKYKIENYVGYSLKEHGKLSLDKLNEIFYPEDKKDLETYLVKGVIKELESLVQFIIANLFINS